MKVNDALTNAKFKTESKTETVTINKRVCENWQSAKLMK